jgi:hypothetical protein
MCYDTFCASRRGMLHDAVRRFRGKPHEVYDYITAYLADQSHTPVLTFVSG